ncbi:MAG: DUF3244 domain-containing protein [Bacteroidales bacterium]|nr:DUF3244 domain-containing protein [Bacteroidales bacterium]
MKKKTLLLAGLCALSLCTCEVQATNSHLASINTIGDNDNVPTGYEIILLKGDLDASVGPNAVVAGANEYSVYIHFNQSFGNVSISIYNAVGNRVYNTVVDTSVQQTVIIPFSNMANGNYTVVLDNANGYAEGDFERN